jgi:hypothetical protein
MSQYIPDQSHQPNFIPHSPSEERYENDPRNKDLNNRVVNWCFGGIIEDSPGSSSGWVFYENNCLEKNLTITSMGQLLASILVWEWHESKFNPTNHSESID